MDTPDVSYRAGDGTLVGDRLIPLKPLRWGMVQTILALVLPCGFRIDPPFMDPFRTYTGIH